MTLKSLILPAVAIAVLGSASPTSAQPKVSPAATRAIAEEAFLYGFPMIMNYGVMYAYAVDTNSGQYKAPFNQIYNTATCITPADTAVITPNSDTPYSTMFMDLRAEPVVICVPEIEKTRYYSVQLVDMYTFNYGYIGSRATGNGAGCYMVAGPDWNGQLPDGVKKIFRSETRVRGGGHSHPTLRSVGPRQREEGAGRV